MGMLGQHKCIDMKVVNLTPHDIVYQNSDGTRIIYPSADWVCRVKTTLKKVESPIPGNTALNRNYESLEGFPYGDLDNIYIVSNPCLAFVPPNAKVVAPATGPNEGCIRDSDGQVEAVTRWIVPSPLEEDTAKTRKAAFLEAAALVDDMAEHLQFSNQMSYGGCLRGPQSKLRWVKKVARELRGFVGVPQNGVWWSPPLGKNKKQELNSNVDNVYGRLVGGPDLSKDFLEPPEK